MNRLMQAMMVLAAAVAVIHFGGGTAAYRITTSVKSLYALLNMPQQHIDDFMKSYTLFEQEEMSGEAEEAQRIVNYYQVINHLCAVGEVEKMYIPPTMDLSQSIFQNQMIWEEKGMADKLDLRPGMKVLDVGCGRGRIAHHVATHTGAKVVGINLDKSQLKLARDYAESQGMLGSQLEFMEANYNHPLPFDDATFDALYHVQALTYAVDLPKLLAEMNRVLKPGAKISFLDWFQLPAYNPEDSKHRKLMAEVKALIGAVTTPTPDQYVTALEGAGFDIIFNDEASMDGHHQWQLIMKADVFFQNFKWIVDFLVSYKLIPHHFSVLIERLTRGGESFVEADKLGLFTTSWQFIAQKRAN
eukprot:TRINITY_DN1284_c0_g1_i5.p1 TRINITY_DN1284_c0_g1~~TRINITY_DN1284_c0_g1_i5.p1  ORF type:complete len:358 (+),score=67.85 TRINITY_DN1284_c0_g1_i5:54-1127(+)